MSDPYLGEVRMISSDRAPRGWALCDGQLLAISTNQPLFSLIGITYGGDGRTTFALPDLRGRAPLHVGATGDHGHTLGQQVGAETHVLTVDEMAAHGHDLRGAVGNASQTSPAGARYASTGADGTLGQPLYGAGQEADQVALDAGTITPTGGGKAHDNMQPYTVIHFIIALEGLRPFA